MFSHEVLLSLFPTPVWVFDLDAAETDAINAALLERLGRIAPTLPDTANDLSLQTDHDFHAYAEFAALGARIEAATAKVVAFLELDVTEPAITGCWINVSPPGARHHEHAHPNNYLSGVYYISTPAGSSSIAFYDPRPHPQIIMPPVKRRTPFTGTSMTVSIQAGRLILFPAWLRHGVEPNRGAENRISLSFNVMFKSFTERYSRPMWSAKLKRPALE